MAVRCPKKRDRPTTRKTDLLKEREVSRSRDAKTPVLRRLYGVGALMKRVRPMKTSIENMRSGKMRRTDREITDREARSLLMEAPYGVLSTTGADGNPYGVPLNFCVMGDCIYFHSAPEGRKIDNIEYNRSVSFCVVGNVEVLADKFSTRYESVIVFGEIEEVFNSEKQIALEGLLRKYCPEFFEKGLRYIEEAKHKTRVFRVNINKLTGKARR